MHYNKEKYYRTCYTHIARKPAGTLRRSSYSILNRACFIILPGNHNCLHNVQYYCGKKEYLYYTYKDVAHRRVRVFVKGSTAIIKIKQHVAVDMFYQEHAQEQTRGCHGNFFAN